MRRVDPDSRDGPDDGHLADGLGDSAESTYIFDLTAAAAAGDPIAQNAFEQFVSECDGDASILSVAVDEDPQVPSRSASAPRSTPPPGATAARAATSWVDRKTLVTIAVTMVMTASVVALALRAGPGVPGKPAIDTTTPDAPAAGTTPQSPISSIQARADVLSPPHAPPDPAARDVVAVDAVIPEAAIAERAAEAPSPIDEKREPQPRRLAGASRVTPPTPASSAEPATQPGALRVNVRDVAISDLPVASSGTTAADIIAGMPVAGSGSSLSLPTLAAVPLEPPVESAPSADVRLGVAREIRSTTPETARVEETPVVAPRPSVAPRDMIRELLNRYQEAFTALDAGAAKAVWPSVDLDALERAFHGLQSQRVQLRNCEITVEDVRARATCGGTLRYVPRVGDKWERTERRQFQFVLQRVDDAWAIDQVESR